MTLSHDVVDRLLLAKDLLGKIRFSSAADPDRLTLATYILTAHDAAELALAAIAQHLGKLPGTGESFLMKYFPKIRETHPTEDVPGRGYFAQLNQVRIDIKHLGIFPDPKQWFRVGETTYGYVTSWCEKYLGIALEDLDESSLISDPVVKQYLDAARTTFSREDYRGVLENLGLAMETLFQSNQALRNLTVGSASAEDAIKLSAFGVHANDFLALQEFLPRVYSGEDTLKISWKQDNFGHPANWKKYAAEFCLKTFLSVALRIQNAEWIPGAIDFNVVYEYKITALMDGVDIVQDQRKDWLSPTDRVVVRTLQKGQSIRCYVGPKENGLTSLRLCKEGKPVLSILDIDKKIFGEVDAEKVRVTCIPRDTEFVRKYFPDLPEIDYEPVR